MHMYIYMYMRMCMCMCICVCIYPGPRTTQWWENTWWMSEWHYLRNWPDCWFCHPEDVMATDIFGPEARLSLCRSWVYKARVPVCCAFQPCHVKGRISFVKLCEWFFYRHFPSVEVLAKRFEEFINHCHLPPSCLPSSFKHINATTNNH